jgi:hypothetical protein
MGFSEVAISRNEIMHFQWQFGPAENHNDMNGFVIGEFEVFPCLFSKSNHKRSMQSYFLRGFQISLVHTLPLALDPTKGALGNDCHKYRTAASLWKSTGMRLSLQNAITNLPMGGTEMLGLLERGPKNLLTPFLVCVEYPGLLLCANP